MPEHKGARVGEIVEVPLEAAVGSGFEWELVLPEEAAPLVRLIDVKWEKTSDLVGSPSIQKFRFQASAPGKAKILFRYKRPWEDSARNESLVSLLIHE